MSSCWTRFLDRFFNRNPGKQSARYFVFQQFLVFFADFAEIHQWNVLRHIKNV